MRRQVQRQHRGVVVHAVIDVGPRVERTHQVRRGLVPEREEAQNGELRLRIGVGSVRADLGLEPLVLQQVPHAMDVASGALALMDLDDLLLHVNNDLEGHVVRQLAIVHARELRVHETEPPRRVLAQHLVQNLAEAPCRDLDLPVRDRVLDGGDEDVAGLDDVADLRARTLQRLHGVRIPNFHQEDATLLPVLHEDGDDHSDVGQGTQNREQQEAAEVGEAAGGGAALLVVRKRGQFCLADLADHPVGALAVFDGIL
mmetsp:Transcript_9346/g.25369  ORF Transcript_9346/g.25369 Transcript_9346/m.25369 type:complete len:257 (-) Transcript_9346:2416-3186(-)